MQEINMDQAGFFAMGLLNRDSICNGTTHEGKKKIKQLSI